MAETLSSIVDTIQEKLGKEESGKIADDIANILIYEESNNKILQEKDSEISKFKVFFTSSATDGSDSHRWLFVPARL